MEIEVNIDVDSDPDPGMGNDIDIETNQMLCAQRCTLLQIQVWIHT